MAVPSPPSLVACHAVASAKAGRRAPPSCFKRFGTNQTEGNKGNETYPINIAAQPTSHSSLLTNHHSHYYGLGRGCGVGRTLGMGAPLGVGVGRGVEVGVTVAVAVGEGVAVGVDEGVGVAVGEDVGVGVGPWVPTIRYSTLWSSLYSTT